MVFSKSANSDGVVADIVGDDVSNLPIESIDVVDKIRLSSVKTAIKGQEIISRASYPQI